jgi:hypothetical protein
LDVRDDIHAADRRAAFLQRAAVHVVVDNRRFPTRDSPRKTTLCWSGMNGFFILAAFNQ